MSDFHDLLGPVVRALQQGLGDDLVAIALFGSQTRGQACPESDWDRLVLAENLPPSPWRRLRRVQGMLPLEWRYRIGIVAHTPAEWFARVTPLALDIALDGIVLYERPQNIFSARLASLRDQISRSGLERRALGTGEWIWLWRDPPRRNWTLEWMP